mmetsp:Transcript_8270/g.19435  ORF Transcript_8270/g.19435 Transcript_8270/m.19435 type:complete len:421 (+) Transcript_8270:67-1329(+)
MTELVLAAGEHGILATDLRSGALVASLEDAGGIQPNAFGCVDQGCEHIFAVQAQKALWQVWDWGKKPSYRASLPEKITAMTFSADSSLCFAGAASGTLYVWAVATGTLLRCWPAHFREITQILASQDGGYLVTSSADSTVHVYNLADVFSDSGATKPFHSWSGHSLSVTSLAFLGGSSDPHQVVATGSLDRSVRLWDVGTGKPLASRSLSGQVHCLSASAAASELFVACGSGALQSLSASSFASDAGSYIGHSGAVQSCAVARDGSRVASCSDVDRVRIWETRTRQCVSQLHANRDIKVSAVKIFRRTPYLPGIPPFQPFQRLLTPADELPGVPRCVSGRKTALRQQMGPYTKCNEILEHVQWTSGALATKQASEDTNVPEDLGTLLEQARQRESRWAMVATQLYEFMIERGLDIDVDKH